jgi:hypothetical protein
MEKDRSFTTRLIDYLKPKAHDAIDYITETWEASTKTPSILEGMSPENKTMIENLVMGLIGGGKGKAARQLVLALKGKLKGGKFIPDQPIRRGIVGKTQEIPKPPKSKNKIKLEKILNKLKDNPNIGGNISRIHQENIKRYKPKK